LSSFDFPYFLYVLYFYWLVFLYLGKQTPFVVLGRKVSTQQNFAQLFPLYSLFGINVSFMPQLALQASSGTLIANI